MKKVYFIVLILTLSIAFIKCKPAAEDRVKMHVNANRIADSIGKVIDAAMAEVAIKPKEGATPTDTSKK